MDTQVSARVGARVKIPYFQPAFYAPTCQGGPFTVTFQTFSSTVYFRALVNFTRSIEYSPQLEDASAKEFREVSEAVVDKVHGRERT